jgi:hypothetical protein
MAFAGILLLLERQQIVEMSASVLDIYRGRGHRPSSQVTEE